MSVIDDKYASLSDAAQRLGQPTGLEGDAANGGRFRHYQFGSIYWHRDRGVHEVHGAIHAAWANQGWERSPLGYPTSDEGSYLLDSIRISNFQIGSLCADPRYPDLPVFPAGRGQSRLLIVTPSAFRDALKPLVIHKRSTNRPTIVLDIETVKQWHGEGRDTAERLKRLIAGGHTNHHIDYVMLLGDASLIPVRYRRTMLTADENWTDSWYTPSDLYYAALFRGHQIQNGEVVDSLSNELDDWDANGNHRFNEHHWADDTFTFNPDRTEGCADLAIARVPAHDPRDVTVYGNKVIAYESGSRRATSGVLTVLADAKYEANAALATSLAHARSSPYPARIVGINYAPDQKLPRGVERAGVSAIEQAVAGSTWVAWVGHGYAAGWATEERGVPFDRARVAVYTNQWLPVVFACGCTTGRFVNRVPNDGAYQSEDFRAHCFGWEGGNNGDQPTHVWDTGTELPTTPHVQDWVVDSTHPSVYITVPAPSEFDFVNRHDGGFASAWLFNEKGGAIAYFGETTVAQDNWGTDLGSYMLGAMAHDKILGDAWLRGQRAYWKQYHESNDRIGAARLYLTYMTMFGDPTLLVG
jgi:hypothetical protein